MTEYKSPQLETLGFDLVKARLVHMGYPKEIMQFEYDPSFPVRMMMMLMPDDERTYEHSRKISLVFVTK